MVLTLLTDCHNEIWKELEPKVEAIWRTVWYPPSIGKICIPQHAESSQSRWSYVIVLLVKDTLFCLVSWLTLTTKSF